MNLRLVSIGFRLAFVVTLCVVTWLALTSMPMPAIVTWWDKADHLTAFIVLSCLLDYSFPQPNPRADWWKWLLLLAYGIGIEFVQGWLGTRDFEIPDMLTDALGIGCWLLVRPLDRHIPILCELRAHRPNN